MPRRLLTVLFYHHPAREWNQALPLGNGRLGAMVFGNVNAERIQLNENTLWMGAARETNNPDALKHLPEVRRLLFAGLPVEAYAVAEKHSMGRPFRLESYQTLGDLRLTFEHEGTPTDYRFELDIDSAIARLTYRLGGVRYTREVFASHPAQAIVLRLSADTPGKISVSTWIDRVQDANTEVVGQDRLDLVGSLGGGKGLSFLASVKILAEAGRVEPFPERILTEQCKRPYHRSGCRNELSRRRPSCLGRPRAIGGRGDVLRPAQGRSHLRSSAAVPARQSHARIHASRRFVCRDADRRPARAGEAW